MTNNPNELTVENSALVLIDHQPAVGLAVHSIDQGLLVTNVAALAGAAKALLAAYRRRGPHDRVRDRPSHSRSRAGTRLPVCSCSGRG